MWWRLFGLDPELAKEASGWTFQWSALWPVWAVALAAAVLIAYAWNVYRREASPLLGVDTAALTAMRIVAVAVLFIMIFEPVVVWDIPVEKDATLLVLVDDSQSMSVADRYEGSQGAKLARVLYPDETKDWAGNNAADLPSAAAEPMKKLSRAGIVNRLFERPASNPLVSVSEMFNVRVETFSEDLKPAASGFRKAGDPLTSGVAADLTKVKVEPEGQLTRAGDLLRKAASVSKERIAGAVLITDGASNVGEDLDTTARYLRDRGIPVYPVGVGNPKALRDVALSNVAANRIVMLNDLVAVDFDLECQGYGADCVPVKVRLYWGDTPVEMIQDGRRVDTAVFDIGERKAEKDGVEVSLPTSCRIAFQAGEIGDFNYRLVAEPRPEELIALNNASTFPVRVIKNQIKVLFIDGVPRWEYQYLKNALMRDETMKVSCFLASADFDFPQEGTLPLAILPTKEEELAVYDVVIIGDVPKKLFSDQQLELFHRFVERLGGGLLMEAGPFFAPREYRGTVMEKMLPADISGPGASPQGTSAEWKPVLTPEGDSHAMTRFDANAEANRKIWDGLAGFYWHYPIDRAKPGAQVLLTHPTDRSQWGPRPLLMTQFYGSGKTAFLAVDSTWLWRGRIGDRWFAKFWGQVIRDLSQGKFIGTSKRFRVATDRSEYRAGEKVTLTARVLDKDFEPSRQGEIRARVEAEGQAPFTVKLDAVAGDPGSYRGRLTTSLPGSYKVTLDLAEPGLDDAAISHQFIVSPSHLEFVDPHLRRDDLKRLSEATGGKYMDIQDIGDLPPAIFGLKQSTLREAPDEMWNAPILFAIFCFAFFSELVYRKMRKLL